MSSVKHPASLSHPHCRSSFLRFTTPTSLFHSFYSIAPTAITPLHPSQRTCTTAGLHRSFVDRGGRRCARLSVVPAVSSLDTWTPRLRSAYRRAVRSYHESLSRQACQRLVASRAEQERPWLTPGTNSACQSSFLRCVIFSSLTRVSTLGVAPR